MRASQALLCTLRADPKDAEVRSFALLVRAGYIHQLSAGIYTYGPLMRRVLRKIEAIIHEAHAEIGAQEILMPALQPRSLWEKSGRWRRYEEEKTFYQLKDSRERTFCLGPTHEEVVTDLASTMIRSGRQLPQIWYQVQTKFRDERRARSGLLRAREFLMKDAYAFDRDAEGMERTYERMRAIYQQIFARCGVSVLVVQADPGAIGSGKSEEFMAPAQAGEDEIVQLSEGAANIEWAQGQGVATSGQRIRAIEVGHIFQLGTRYTAALGATVAGAHQQEPLWMGCYGIGVSRLAQVIAEQRCDVRGLCWPEAIAPYRVHLLQSKPKDDAQTALALRVYEALRARSVEVLWDDRVMGMGAKLKDADLLGLPIRLVVGRAEGVEWCARQSGSPQILSLEEAVKRLEM